jgi:hypothetical protein
MNILSHPDPEGYGPMGTPNRGRDERIAKSDRETARRYREAAMRLERDAESTNRSELRSLHVEHHRLLDETDQLRQQFAALRSALPEIITDILAEDLPHAVSHLIGHHNTRTETNGSTTQNHTR